MKKRICANCGGEMEFALPPSGDGERSWQCFECDRPDPFRSPVSRGWLAGELAPKE